MSQQAFDQLLQKYLSGQCTPEEEKIIIEWYNQLVEKTALDLSASEKIQIERRLWSSIKQTIPAEDQYPPVIAPVKKTAGKKRYLALAVAACMVLLAGIAIYWFTGSHTPGHSRALPEEAQYQIFANNTAVDKQLILGDSTIITMRPGSVIYYPKMDDGGTRRVKLKGSAFFAVHHDPFRHFEVQVNDALMTEVLGTSFNIIQNKAADKLIEIQLVTGKIRVYQPPANNGSGGDAYTNSVILTPNKKVVFNAVSNQLITSLIDHPKPIPKTEAGDTAINHLLFEDATLAEVCSKLSEIYGVSILPENDGVGHCHFTGNLAGYDLYTQLDNICRTTQKNYEVKGAEILIKGEACP